MQLFPDRYETRGMLQNYLRAQYGPYLNKNPTADFEDFYKKILFFARRYIRAQTRVLDIGCATGRLVFEYSKVGALHSTGTDISQKFIDACNAIESGTSTDVHFPLFGGKTLFLKDDINQTKLPLASFEFISCINLLDRVTDPDLLIRIIGELLLPGGVVLLADPYDWELSPAPKRQHTKDMKSLLPKKVWRVIEDTWIPFKFPLTDNRNREYTCNVVIAQKI